MARKTACVEKFIFYENYLDAFHFLQENINQFLSFVLHTEEQEPKTVNKTHFRLCCK